MEERKLIKLGNASFAIALPKGWIDKSGLKKGDKIFLEHNGNGELTVSSTFRKRDEKVVEINLEDKAQDSEFLKRHLHALYTKGYSKVIFRGLKDKKLLEHLLKDYLSFEVMESNGDTIIAKDFFDLDEIKFENLVRRIDNCLRDMFDTSILEIKKTKTDQKAIKELEETDASVNKFYFLCSRIFMKGIDNPSVLNTLKLDGNKLFNNWWMSFHLESLGDGMKHALKWIFKLEPKKRAEILEIMTKLQQNYILSMEAFYSEDSNTALKAIEATKAIRGDIDKLEEDVKILKITEALEMVRKSIYQNAKMTSYIKY